MRFLPFITIVNFVSAQKIYQGFNAGAFFDSEKPKVKSDFMAEFNTAKSLHYSPGIFNSARLYTNVQKGTTDTPIEAFEAAIETNTSLLLGIWCSGTSTIDSELKALKTAVDKHGSKLTDLVIGLSVGSEDLYRLSESGIENQAGIGAGPSVVVNFIKKARDAIAGTALSKMPVGHVDSWSAWQNKSNKAVVEAVDFLGMDLYPYYEKDRDNRIEKAEELFEELHNETTTAAGKKPVWITETGWPTSGPASGNATTSVQNAKTYWDLIACKYVGRVNVFWYTLQDADPAIEEKYDSKCVGVLQ